MFLFIFKRFFCLKEDNLNASLQHTNNYCNISKFEVYSVKIVNPERSPKGHLKIEEVIENEAQNIQQSENAAHKINFDKTYQPANKAIVMKNRQ